MGGDLKKKNTPGGKVPGGIFRKAHTHLTHTAAPTMSGLNSIYKKQFKRHKKDSSWGSLRPASVNCDDTSSDKNGKEYCRFFCVPPGGGRFFFAKNYSPGVNSKVEGWGLKKKKNGITQRSYAHSGQFFRGGEGLKGGGGGAHRILRYVSRVLSRFIILGTPSRALSLPPKTGFGICVREGLSGGCRVGIILERCSQLAVFATQPIG